MENVNRKATKYFNKRVSKVMLEYAQLYAGGNPIQLLQLIDESPKWLQKFDNKIESLKKKTERRFSVKADKKEDSKHATYVFYDC